MKTVNWYLAKNVLCSLGIAMAIATFVLMIGQFARVFELLSKGVEFKYLLLFVAYKIPQALGFTVPLSIFIATVLTFHRMSADNEINAFRASGISLNQVIAPLVLLSAVSSALCFLLQFHFVPECNYTAKWMVREQGIRNPLLLLEEGRFVEMFDGYIIYVGRKKEKTIWDVHLYVLGETDKVEQKIDARSGVIEVNTKTKNLELTLHEATVETVDPNHPTNISKNRRIKGDTLSFSLGYGTKLSSKSLQRSVSELKLPQLFARIQVFSERGIDTGRLYGEIHMRAALAVSPFTFILIAIPLGIRGPRKESYYGLIACFMVPFVYYAAIAFIDTLQRKPDFHAEILMWLPNIIGQTVGVWALWIKR